MGSPPRQGRFFFYIVTALKVVGRINAKQLFLVKGVEAELLFGSVVVDCSERMSASDGVLDNVVDLLGW